MVRGRLNTPAAHLGQLLREDDWATSARSAGECRRLHFVLFLFPTLRRLPLSQLFTLSHIDNDTRFFGLDN